MNGRYRDGQSSDTTVDGLERCVDDSYNKEDPYRHESCQFNEIEAIAAFKKVERQANAQDRRELHQGPNVRWVNVRFSEHEGHLTEHRLLLKMRSAIQSQEATITTTPSAPMDHFGSLLRPWAFGSPTRTLWGIGTRKAVLTAAKDIVVSCLGRVRDEGLPFEKDVVFRRAHGRDSAPRLWTPSESSPNAVH